MRHRSKAAALAAVVAMAGCSDGGTDPGGGTGSDETAARFEQLADSVDGEGWSPTAEALRHAAKIVRLAGGATPVTLTVDGQARRFDAVAEQLDFPNIVCTWPDSTVVPPDSGIGGPEPEPMPPDSGMGSGGMGPDGGTGPPRPAPREARSHMASTEKRLRAHGLCQAADAAEGGVARRVGAPGE